MIGEIVGTYRLVEKIGEGSTGEVFLGQHTQTAQKAAVKVFFAAVSKRSIGLSRYFAEVRATNALEHAGIATVYDCGTHPGGRAYLCMELLPGRSLAEALVDLPSGDTATVVAIGAQVAAVLQVVHGKGMVHRGLKPDSIFLVAPMPRPAVKVLDFGAANFNQSVRQSQTGSLLGAPLYMSPEVGRGLGSVDHRADIYSLGCILFELATGRPPFVREGPGELIVAHATEKPPSARTLEPALAPALDALIARMLRKEPEQRPQSMTEIVLALRSCSSPAAATPVFAPTPSLEDAKPSAARQAPHAASYPTPPLPPVPGILATLPKDLPLSSARQADATALLPPSENGAAQTSSTSQPSQPTLLDPSAESVVVTPAPYETRAPFDSTLSPTLSSASAAVLQKQRSQRKRTGAASDSVSLAIVSAVLLCILALVVVFVVRQNNKTQAEAPASRAAPREQFKAPALPEARPAGELVEGHATKAAASAESSDQAERTDEPTVDDRTTDDRTTDPRRAGRPPGRTGRVSPNATPPRLTPQASRKW